MARAQRLLEAHRQAAVVVIERGAGQMAGDLELAAEARHEDVGVERLERAERERAGLQLAAIEPADEHLVEAGGARVPAAEHAKDVVADRARVVVGEVDDRLQDLGRRGLEVRAGVDFGEVLRAASAAQRS